MAPETRLQVARLLAQLSSSRQSIFAREDQRSLFKRLHLLGLAVLAERSDLRSRAVQLELLCAARRLFHLFAEVVFKFHRSFAEVCWRSVLRLLLHALSTGSACFDDEVFHKAWAFLNVLRRRKLEKYLCLVPEAVPVPVDREHPLYSGGMTRRHTRRAQRLRAAVCAGAGLL